MVASAPEALNTLNELAQALASDPNHATTVFNQLATKASTEYVDEKFALKANPSTTYTKTETDNLLTPKATVTYVNDQLALTANQATTYAKTESDNLLATSNQQSHQQLI